MFNLLSGALNISSRNMTNGNFLSGETLLNNGVIDEKIIQEIENIQNTNKVKEGVLTTQTRPARSAYKT